MTTKINKNIVVQNINVSVSGKTLVENSDLKIIHKQKYGLIGRNGYGKTTLLKYISNKIIPIDKYIEIFYVGQELDFDNNKSIYEIVSDANFKKNKLLEKISKLTPLIELDDDAFHSYNKTMEKLKDLDQAKDESKIRKMLFGLGFDNKAQDKPFSYFSGGWRMRVALARGLYMEPHLLLLDEPTNHLDINSVIWLTNYLKNKWKKTLIVVSHDIYFMNKICTNMIHIENKKLNYYNGNYDNFKYSHQHHMTELENKWNKIQKRKKEMQKKSIKKELVDKFLIEHASLEPPKPYRVNIRFHDVSKIKSPYINLSDINFGYDDTLFDDINMRINENEKIIIVGKNGVGKSTLLQLISGKINNFKGEITRNPNVVIGYYNQHLTDILPNDKTPINFLLSENKYLRNDLDARKYLGSIGLEGTIHTRILSTLSGGQRARVVLALINSLDPHILLLDEPTNHLDIESVEALIKAINNFSGTVIMITHNINIIEKINSKILKLENKILQEVSFDNYYDDVLDEIENIM